MGCFLAFVFTGGRSHHRAHTPAGQRIGFLYTYNAALIKAYMPCAISNMISHTTQYAVTKLLEDSAFMDAFMADNQANLEAQSTIVTDSLTNMGVPFIQPEVLAPWIVRFRCHVLRTCVNSKHLARPTAPSTIHLGAA